MVNTSRLTALVAAVCPVFTEGPGDEPFLGINLSAVTYYSTQWVFVDAFRQARPWLPQNVDDAEWDTGETLDLTPEGWPLLDPGQAAGTLLFRGIDGRYPAGEYVCLYEGRGRFEFAFDGRTVESVPGRVVVDVDPSDNGVYLKLVESDQDDPVRNIRFIMPGFEHNYATQVFHPLFLDRMRGFEVLRFMDWQRINDSRISRWTERTKPETYSQALESGVAIELMLDLCDRVNADPWFCVPHLADDDYVREFAELVEDLADPDLDIYIEHSNEVWNTRFEQTEHAAERGLALGLAATEKKAALLYHSQRSVEIFDIWQDVFGSTNRLVRVLATQAANKSGGELVMDHEDAYQSADVLAIAPYFGGYLGSPDNAADTTEMSINQILDRCEDDLDTVELQVTENYEEACERGLRLIAYEGGQHLVGKGPWIENQTLMNRFFDANRDPRMRDLYREYIERWRSSGGAELVMYASAQRYNKFGSWGALEWLGQSIYDAPKYRALRDEINKSCPDPYAYCHTKSNSVGSGARIGWTGTPSIAYDNFEMRATQVPDHAVGAFYYGPDQQSSPFAGGTVCVGGGSYGVFRLAPLSRADGGGIARQSVRFDDRGNLGTIRAGQRWNFQYVYMDHGLGGIVRASDAASVRFCP